MAKFRLRRKIFREKTSQTETTSAGNVIRSTTVQEEASKLMSLSLSLSLSLDRPCGNKHKFCKIPPQKKDFRENLTSWDASNVIRSTTVEERKAITHLSLMIEKKEQEAITHVSLSLSLSLSLWTHKPPHAKAPSLRGSAPSGCTDASHYLLSEFPSALLSEFPSHTSPVRTA